MLSERDREQSEVRAEGETGCVSFEVGPISDVFGATDVLFALSVITVCASVKLALANQIHCDFNGA